MERGRTKSHAVGALFLVGSLATVASAQVLAGGEFRVNTYTTSLQTNPSLASDALGNFIAVWQSLSEGDATWDVFGQRFDAMGRPRGGEFQVNTYTTNAEYRPSVTSDAAGNFIVVWSRWGWGGSEAAVFGRRFDAAGQPRGGEFQVSTSASGYRYQNVAADAAGNFVVVWLGQRGENGYSGVFGRRYDAAGQARGGEFQVNTYTTNRPYQPTLASDAAGNFVVVWTSYYPNDGSYGDVVGRRYDAAGQARGGEFQVNTYTPDSQYGPSVASNSAGDFVVVWTSYRQDGNAAGIIGRRYDAAGQPRGGEFQINTYTTDGQGWPSVASDAAGNFSVAWTSAFQDKPALGVFGQRFDLAGQPRGGEFELMSHPNSQIRPAAAYGPAGDFVVVWVSDGQDGSGDGIFGRRFHGRLGGVALAVDPAAMPGSDGNAVLEAGESVLVKPSWRNVSGQVRAFDGIASSFGGPAAGGVSYQLLDATAAYGMVGDEATVQCSDCYQLAVQASGPRPATHWDATLVEDLTGDGIGQQEAWKLHIGETFTDVPRTSGYYRFVETVVHKGVTSGCSAESYCPADAVTREQMSVFMVVSKEGAGYAPPTCGMPVFGDVPASSPYCRFVEELSRRRIVSGCGGGNYCPTSPVTREQMAVFLLATLDPTLNPPACTTPVFGDVPASSLFCRFIEELARRGITGGCAAGLYCPTDPVTREQMAALITATFGLSLYGP